MMVQPRDDDRVRRTGGTTEVLHRLRREHRIRPPGPRLSLAGWRQASASACLAFLALLCVGVFLLLALRLQFEQLGAGFNPVAIVSAGAVLALASLGAPLHLGEVEVAVIPLGALGVLGVALIWSSSMRIAAVRKELGQRLGPLSHGALTGGIFGLLCLLAAVIFRFRGGPDPVFVGAFQALLWGTVWGSLFGVLGALKSEVSGAVQITALGRALENRSRVAYEGLSSALVMLLSGAVLSCAALLLWAIVALVRDSVPIDLSWRSAAAALIYLVAFAPNVVLICLGLSMGAPVEVGGRISVAGNSFGRLAEYSLLDWGSADTPAVAFVLLLIPLLAGVLGGGAAHRQAADKRAALEVVGAAALWFGVLVLILVALSEARLGAGLFGRRGVARVAADPLSSGALAAGWGAALGWVGWKLQEWRSSR